MKSIIKSISVSALLGASFFGAAFQASAATQEEMERARTIAAQVYIRYNDDDASYLDGYKPQNMADLRAKIAGRDKDEALLNEFMRAPVSNDYPQWGQEEMVNYWGDTFFASSGLSDKGAKARNAKIMARLRTMDVTPPSAEQPTQPAPAPEQQPQQPMEDLGAHPQEVTLGDQSAPAPVSVDTTTVSEETVNDARESGSNLWLYIVLLIILIGVVIALVVYAMKAMRSQNQTQASSADTGNRPMPQRPVSPEPHPVYEAPEPVYSAPRQSSVSAEEIDRLRQQVDDYRQAEAQARMRAEQLAARVGALQLEIQRLTEENASLRAGAAQMPRPVVPQPAPGAPKGYALDDDTAYGHPVAPRYEEPPTVIPQAAPAVPQRPAQTGPISNERVIYLGRANRQRIFVRADKHIVHGKTIYRLVTTNGITGSFTVESDPSIVGWVSLDPETALFGGSEVATFANASTFRRIVTDSPGTAIFEDGCWKVLRPAAVHLE